MEFKPNICGWFKRPYAREQAARQYVCPVADHTEMRNGFDSLTALVQTAPQANPFFNHLFVFHGRRGDILMLLWFGGQSLRPLWGNPAS